MKSSPLQPLRNLQILSNPSRYLTGLILLKVTMHNMIKLRLWSPHCYLYPCKFTNRNPCTPIYYGLIHQEDQWQHILLFPTPLWKWWTSSENNLLWPVLISSPISTYTPNYVFLFMPHTNLLFVLQVSLMPYIITSRLPLSGKLFIFHPIYYTGSSSAYLTSVYNIRPMVNMSWMSFVRYKALNLMDASVIQYSTCSSPL